MLPSSLRILVVEDTSAIRVLLETMLRNAGHAVEGASDGREALERFRRSRYDLVMMDLRMPALDGAAAARLMRAHEKGAGLPAAGLIALTADADAPPDAAREAGFDEQLLKPFARDALFGAIERALRARKGA